MYFCSILRRLFLWGHFGIYLHHAIRKFHCLFFSSILPIKKKFSCVSTFVIAICCYLTNFLFTQKFVGCFLFLCCFWFPDPFSICLLFFVHVLWNLLRMQNDKLDFDPVYLFYLIHNLWVFIFLSIETMKSFG